MLCPNCNKPMKNVMHFERDRKHQFNECNNFCKKTKNKRIHFDDILEKELSKLNKIK